jgi:hypothetical protein
MMQNAVGYAFPFTENETLGNGNADILTFNIYSFLFTDNFYDEFRLKSLYKTDLSFP